ncbi:receptor-like protein kinase HERK 1 [Rutidosis leptorrhynchoides]|uniref:receptor-like protein kinase HERK 1 n=1 Tax=Rutidosis leptorrhynchoides TaxID=125765 RepID=UPI003A9A5822
MSYTFKEFDYLQIPYDDIVAATNNFDEYNFIFVFSYCNKVYRGELFRFGKKINVIVEKCENMKEDEILKRVSMLSRFKHKNIATFVGFCYEYGHSYFVTELAVTGINDHIQQIISVSRFKSDSSLYYLYKNLTCYRRLQICLGAARALSHIHEQKAVHGEFNGTRILLDKDLEAKVMCFVIKRRNRIWSDDLDIDPLSENIVTQKTDVYSFGKVLVEMFCERDPILNNQIAFDDDILNQMQSEAFTILNETLYKYLNKHEWCPDMAEIGRLLEKALFFQWKHEKTQMLPSIYSYVVANLTCPKATGLIEVWRHLNKVENVATKGVLRQASWQSEDSLKPHEDQVEAFMEFLVLL